MQLGKWLGAGYHGPKATLICIFLAASIIWCPPIAKPNASRRKSLLWIVLITTQPQTCKYRISGSQSVVQLCISIIERLCLQSRIGKKWSHLGVQKMSNWKTLLKCSTTYISPWPHRKWWSSLGWVSSGLCNARAWPQFSILYPHIYIRVTSNTIPPNLSPPSFTLQSKWPLLLTWLL
jgi:hypothetical protein